MFSSDCESQSKKSTGQEEGLFPIVKALKIPAVSMIGEYIDVAVNSDYHKFSLSLLILATRRTS